VPLTPGTKFGPYEVVAALGAGAMGEVWRARDARLSRDVALKVLPESLAQDQERLQRFEREAQVLASLNHPNIAAIYGLEVSAGATALVLEIVEGPTLDERIAQGALPIDDAVTIARQIAEALEYAHERGVVHRDLKPANVKLSSDGRVKVLDFGLAKAIAPDMGGRSDSAVSPTITSLGTVAGVILGTAAYMAPEQARGSNIDRRADIWSFGVVLWEMLSGKRLFDDATVSDTLAAVLRAPIEWDGLPASTPGGVRRLLKRCLERDPKKRLRDIGEARYALEHLEEDPGATIAMAAAPAPRRSIASTLTWLAALVVVAIATTAIAGFLKKPAVPKPVVRFMVPAAEGISEMRWPRVSPDGTMIAFQARSGNARPSIWVRPVDAFEARELQGTEGAQRHWWSPESKYIAFFIGNQLKKVPATGGPIQLIAEGESGADGDWGSSGVILFDGRAIDPIHRVNAGGGKPELLPSKPDTAQGEAGHAWPFFLPDGKHFLFLATSNNPSKKGTIKVGSLDGAPSIPLVSATSRAEFADGYLLYVLDGTLVAQRFDTEKMGLTGEPVPLAEKVNTDANGAAAFSASRKGTLAFMTATSAGESTLVWVDRSGKELAKLGEPGLYRDLDLSPDGARLAYGLADPRAGGEDIWIRDLKRDVASRFTFGPGVELWPVWSPDGKRVVFASDKTGAVGTYEKDANGAATEREMITDPGGPVGPSSWSPDGKTLAVSFLPATRRMQIKTFSVQGPPTLVDFAVSDVAQSGAIFSPDGRYVAYSSNESGTREVYVQTMPPGGGKWQISSNGGDSAAWRADGKELFYKTLNDEFVAVAVTTGAHFEPGASKILFKRNVEKVSGASVARRWTVSADGQQFLINASHESRGAPFAVILNWPETIADK
jgi:Tol biopolymer transport system component